MVGRMRGAATLLASALAVIVPWSVTASLSENRFVPSATARLRAVRRDVLPGDGRSPGSSASWPAETRRLVPDTRHLTALQIPAEKVLRVVALAAPE